MSQRFCSACGAELIPDARFCHACGAPAAGRSTEGPSEGRSAGTRAAAPRSKAIPWAVPGVAIAAVIALTVFAVSRASSSGPAGAVNSPAAAMRAPDISAMSPQEQVDRLFNRVMRLSVEGKADSAAFFAPMAIGALESLGPANAHVRYDIGLVALVAGDVPRAVAESEAILRERPTHLLGLSLAARAADARGDAAAARTFRQRMVAAERAELAQALPEYADHDADLRDALELAKRR